MATNRLCSAEGCDKPYWAKGYCSTHYQRMRHKGTVEDDAFKFRNRRLEYIHEVVLTHEGDECLAWPYAMSPRPVCAIKGVPFNVCRYVCEKVHGPAPEPWHQAAHSCGKGHEGCVSPHHLSWKTPKENEKDKMLHGTRLLGERSPVAVVSDADVIKIRAIGRTLPQRVIAEMFGTERSNVGRILRGDTRKITPAISSPG